MDREDNMGVRCLPNNNKALYDPKHITEIKETRSPGLLFKANS